MNDHILREATKKKIIPRHLRSGAFVVEELNLRHGAARIDIVVIGDLLHGFELKSDSDNLDRLADQARVYNDLFDKMTLIVGYKHAHNALHSIPDWWGVKLAHTGPRGGVHFNDARSARPNPKKDLVAVASLLLRNEAINLLEEFGHAEGLKNKPAVSVYQRLAETARPEEVQQRIYQQIRIRIAWKLAAR
jgi:hypothetical protein